MDIGGPGDTVLLAGMGRSGTTWVGDIINCGNNYRVLFEPFLPSQVQEAADFEYIQYLPPEYSNESLSTKALAILNGKVHNEWVDRDTKKLFYRRRIVKDIRCNLMLGWLKRISKTPPVVLVIRHPLQVASSWRRLAWGEEVSGKRSDLEIILSQDLLLDHFPVIAETYKTIDPHDFVERVVFQWCVFHLVPFCQLKKDEAYVLFYENLLIDPGRETEGLFQYLNMTVNRDALKKTMRESSSTNFVGRDFEKDSSQLLSSWKNDFTAHQIQRTHEILRSFDLDDIYGKDGHPANRQLLRG